MLLPQKSLSTLAADVLLKTRDPLTSNITTFKCTPSAHRNRLVLLSCNAALELVDPIFISLGFDYSDRLAELTRIEHDEFAQIRWPYLESPDVDQEYHPSLVTFRGLVRSREEDAPLSQNGPGFLSQYLHSLNGKWPGKPQDQLLLGSCHCLAATSYCADASHAGDSTQEATSLK